MSYIALNASSKLTGVVGVGVTTVPVTGGTGTQFAVGTNHSYVTLQDATNKETCKITGQSGDNLTVVRTKALSWAIGTVIECRPCAEAMADYAVAPQVVGSGAAAIADADEIGFVDASASNVLAKITFANFRTALKTYFDGIYRAVTGDVYLAAGASVVFEGTTDDAFETTLSAGDPTADRTATLPDKSGTVAMLDDVVSAGASPIINGAFSINQRAAATNADDTYAHDRWNVLTQTGTIALSTLTDVEDTTPFMARLTQSQASAQRMGYSQIIEGKNCKHLRGQQVTFRFGRERLSASANIRIAVLEWTGTEDAVTSDVVNDWTSGTYTAGNFFLAANLTVSAVVQQALVANTLTDGSAVTVTLGSAFNNLIVFAWTEATAAQNVTLDLGKAQIEKAASASAFVVPDYAVELARCQRYLPAFRASGAGTNAVGTGGVNASANAIIFFLPKVPPRVSPTGVLAGYTTASHFNIGSGVAGVAASSVAFASASPHAIFVTVVAAGLTVGQGCICYSTDASAAILFDGCEL